MFEICSNACMLHCLCWLCDPVLIWICWGICTVHVGTIYFYVFINYLLTTPRRKAHTCFWFLQDLWLLLLALLSVLNIWTCFSHLHVLFTNIPVLFICWICCVQILQVVLGQWVNALRQESLRLLTTSPLYHQLWSINTLNHHVNSLYWPHRLLLCFSHSLAQQVMCSLSHFLTHSSCEASHCHPFTLNYM